jgi:hypothetical protein
LGQFIVFLPCLFPAFLLGAAQNTRGAKSREKPEWPGVKQREPTSKQSYFGFGNTGPDKRVGKALLGRVSTWAHWKFGG